MHLFKHIIIPIVTPHTEIFVAETPHKHIEKHIIVDMVTFSLRRHLFGIFENESPENSGVFCHGKVFSTFLGIM